MDTQTFLRGAREQREKDRQERQRIRGQRKHPGKHGHAPPKNEYWRRKKGQVGGVLKLPKGMTLGVGRRLNRMFESFARKFGDAGKARKHLREQAKMQRAEEKAATKRRTGESTIQRWRRTGTGIRRGQ